MAKVVLADHTKPMEEEGLKLRLINEATGAEAIWTQNGDYKALSKEMMDADVVLVHRAKIDAELLDASPKLGLIIKCGIGVDTIDVDAATARNIRVVNNPERGPEVGEHTLGLLLSLLRRISLADRHARQKQFPKTYDFTYMGTRSRGKTVGMVGVGKIPRDVIPAMQALGMKIIAYSRSLTPEKAREIDVTAVNLDTLFSTADIISLHCPLSDETRGLVNSKTLAKMKDGVIIINTARGEVVREADLVEAIRSGKVGGYATDVSENEPIGPSNPLLEFDNVIMTPHMGWSSKEALTDGETVPARQAIQYIRGEEVDYVLNKVARPKTIMG